MGIAEGMKNIVENIVDSHIDRTKALKDLVAETCKTIKGFAADRKQMSKEQAENLANFVTDLTENVGDLIKGFQDNRKEMSEKQAKDLAMFVGRLEKDVSSMLEDFKKSHKEMAEELREKLAKEVKDIKTEVDELISGYRTDMKGAKVAWQGISSILAKSGKAGVKPKIEAGEKITTVEEIIEKSIKKAGKKKKK